MPPKVVRKRQPKNVPRTPQEAEAFKLATRARKAAFMRGKRSILKAKENPKKGSNTKRVSLAEGVRHMNEQRAAKGLKPVGKRLTAKFGAAIRARPRRAVPNTESTPSQQASLEKMVRSHYS